MRLLIVLLLGFGLISPAMAARPMLAQMTGASAPAQPAAAPQEPAGAIIPGSPLAALTGATPLPAPPPAPFGTDRLAFSVSGTIGHALLRASGDFLAAMRAATQLAPVLDWLRASAASPARRAEAAAIGLGLAAVFLPALAVDLLLRLGLRGAGHWCADRASAPGAAKAGMWRGWGRRLGYGVLRLLLALLPLAGFLVMLVLLLSAGLLATRGAHLAVIGIANAYLVCRMGLEVLRFVLAPRDPGLRLAGLSDGGARAAARGGLMLLATGFAAYGLISVAEILGLPRAGTAVLLRLAALLFDLEIVLFIWRLRAVAGRWIAGPPAAQGGFAMLRRRLSVVWHYLAMAYVLALWVAWAGGVPDAFVRLLRGVAVLLVVLVLGRLAWSASLALLARALPPGGAGEAPDSSPLRARARAYNPLARFTIRLTIGLLALLLLLQGWGVDVFGLLSRDPVSRALLGALGAIAMIIILALVLWEGINFALNARVESLSATGRARQASRLRTLLPMLRASIGVVIFTGAALFSLTKIGLNAAPLLAGAGVVGIAVGFGSQKLVQDVITGLFLLLEDAMQVGDVVSLAGMSGTVERLSIRTIRLRGFDGSVNIIPFSAVTAVTNMTRDFGLAQIAITVGYQENLERVRAEMTAIASAMRAEPGWGAMIRDDLQIFGLDSFGTLGLVITGQIRTGPGQHWAVRREFYARVQKRFGEAGITIPNPLQAAPAVVLAGGNG